MQTFQLRSTTASLIVGYGISCAVLLAGCLAESSSAKPWHIAQASSKSYFQTDLHCETEPTVGPYQVCVLKLTDRNGKPVLNAQLAVDGGMPAHGHGLPTAPVAVLVDQQGTYQINGLQYNMPGAWLLGFLIRTPERNDKVVFDFVI